MIKNCQIALTEQFNQQGMRLCSCSITVSELYFGAEKSNYPARNLTVIEDFLSRLVVLPYDIQAASHRFLERIEGLRLKN